MSDWRDGPWGDGAWLVRGSRRERMRWINGRWHDARGRPVWKAPRWFRELAWDRPTIRLALRALAFVKNRGRRMVFVTTAPTTVSKEPQA